MAIGALYFTRDAAINTMNAACFLEPEVAKNTLWAVCEKVEGQLCFQLDKQSWDKIVWALGAWSYYLATGDKEFLKYAYETVRYSLAVMEKMQYNERFGLFTGGSFFNDGITGYPKRLHQEGNRASFVKRHPDTAYIMTLSTNCLYCRAYDILADMVRILDGNKEEMGTYQKKAQSVKNAINKWLWNEEKGTYGYFVYPDGGWQVGIHWESVADQTWSATGYIRMIVYGMFGVSMDEEGISFVPCLPEGLDPICLKGLCIRGIEMELALYKGEEGKSKILINGEPGDKIFYSKPGKYRVEMWVG